MLASSLTLLACSSAPAPRLHSLVASAPVQPREPAASTPVVTAFVLEPIRLPASVDQPQWLVRLPDDSLVSLESERWASPLRDEFREALLVELVGRYRAIDARDDRAFALSAWRVRVDVSRFESIAGREARIEGAWTLTAPMPTIGAASQPSVAPPVSLHCNWSYSEPASSGIADLAAAHRLNVIRLADGIGEALTRLQRNDTARCPAV